MSNPKPTPPPRNARKFFVIASAIVVLMIVAIFIGMNAQHAKDTQDRQAGKFKPQDAPLTEKDLGKAPLPK